MPITGRCLVGRAIASDWHGPPVLPFLAAHYSQRLHSNGSSTKRERCRFQRLIIDRRRRFNVAGLVERLLLSCSALLVVPKLDQPGFYLPPVICVHCNTWRRVIQIRVQRCGDRYWIGLKTTGASRKHTGN